MTSNSQDERPEQIHMVVCGIVFFGVYGLLRGALHWSHLIASIAVIIAALPLMYVSLPLTTLIYYAISKPETRRSNIHVTDAGITTLVFFVVVLLIFGVLKSMRHKPQPLPHQSARLWLDGTQSAYSGFYGAWGENAYLISKSFLCSHLGT